MVRRRGVRRHFLDCPLIGRHNCGGRAAARELGQPPDAVSGAGRGWTPRRGTGAAGATPCFTKFGAIMAIHPVAEAALLFALVLAAAGGLFWLVKRLRDVEADDTPTASDLLSNFRELHARGGLSDEEYRTIKTKLAAQLQDDMQVDLETMLAETREESRRSSVAGDAGQGAL